MLSSQNEKASQLTQRLKTQIKIQRMRGEIQGSLSFSGASIGGWDMISWHSLKTVCLFQTKNSYKAQTNKCCSIPAKRRAQERLQFFQIPEKKNSRRVKLFKRAKMIYLVV